MVDIGAIEDDKTVTAECEMEDVEEQYEDPTMIFTKSRVTIGLLSLVIITLSTMMIFVILSVRVGIATPNHTQPQYVISKSSHQAMNDIKYKYSV